MFLSTLLLAAGLGLASADFYTDGEGHVYCDYAPRNCYSLGYRGYGTDNITDDMMECAENTQLRGPGDCYEPEEGKEADECCQESCFSRGWKNAGVADATTSCPEGTAVREEWDYSFGNFSSASFCCRTNCFYEGWRTAGDDQITGTSHVCSAGLTARGEGDFHQPPGAHHTDEQAYTEDECCSQQCEAAFGGDAAVTCAATYGENATLMEGSTCAGLCEVEQCCRNTCSGDCPAGMEAKQQEEWESCRDPACPQSECCGLRPDDDTAEKNCWNAGFRPFGTAEDDSHVACPASTVQFGAEWSEGCGYDPTGLCYEHDCCRSTCFLQGWRDNGDTSADVAHNCPINFEARPEGDGHSPFEFTEEECCQTNCHKQGWRNNGDPAAAADHQCPVGTFARSHHDGHRPGDRDYSEEECCQQACSDWGSEASCADKGHGTETFFQDRMCPPNGCDANECCGLQCAAGFNASGCGDGMMKRTMMGEDRCWDDEGGCSAEQCCESKPTAEQWNCYYFGESGEGWRDNGDDSGTEQCPAGSMALGSMEYIYFQPDEAKTWTAENCCRVTCWSSGWRNDGDTTGSGTTEQCPSNAEVRSKDDGHSPMALSAEECCRPTCGLSGFTPDKCPVGSTFGGADEECYSHDARTTFECQVEDCCYTTCLDSGFTNDASCNAGGDPAGGWTLQQPAESTRGFSPDRDARAECCRVASGGSCYETGFRDHGDSSGSYQCSEGMEARDARDEHRCTSRGDEGEEDYCYGLKECCLATCSGWVINGGGSTAGTQQCPAGMVPQRDGDGRCRAFPCEQHECCSFTCADFAGACPTGMQRHKGSEEIGGGRPASQEECCYVGCGIWEDGGGTCSKDGDVVESEERCDDEQVSGCNEDKCCRESGPCDAFCGETDSKCVWDASAATECAAADECEPESCDLDGDGALTDMAACKTELETCRTCWKGDPTCAQCVECYSLNYFNMRLPGMACEDNDARVKTDSQGTFDTCLELAAFGLCDVEVQKNMSTPPGWVDINCCSTCAPPATTQQFTIGMQANATAEEIAAAAAAAAAAADAASAANAATRVDIVTRAQGQLDVVAGTEDDVLKAIFEVICGNQQRAGACDISWDTLTTRARRLVAAESMTYTITIKQPVDPSAATAAPAPVIPALTKADLNEALVDAGSDIVITAEPVQEEATVSISVVIVTPELVDGAADPLPSLEEIQAKLVTAIVEVTGVPIEDIVVEATATNPDGTTVTGAPVTDAPTASPSTGDVLFSGAAKAVPLTVALATAVAGAALLML